MNQEFETLVKGEHYDPHRILGGHPYQRGDEHGVIVRAFHPDGVKVSLCMDGRTIERNTTVGTAGFLP